MTAISTEVGGVGSNKRVRWTFVLASALVVAFLVFLVVRRTGSYNTPVDGWGVDVFELSMGALCIRRYFEASWRSSQRVARAFPLVLGVAGISWALGDVALTIESLGGATAPVPSVADGFYVGFFPLCFAAFMMVVRRGTNRSVIATSLDGIIVGLGVASISAAFIFSAVLKRAGGTSLAAATNMAYPVGDLLLVALALGGLSIPPREYRKFFVVAAVGMAADAIGDSFNLLGATGKLGYVADAVAWPIALLALAVATWIQPADARTQIVYAGSMSNEKTAGFTLPALGALAGMSVLFFATFGHVGKTAAGLATGALFVAGVRLILTLREAQALTSARFRSLVDNAWDIIVVTEANLEVAYITPSSERVLGYTPGDLQGGLITAIVHRDDVDAAVDHLRRLPEGGTETAPFETRLRHRNGTWRTIAWTATNLLSDPSIRGYVLNGGDVTETRQAAEDLAAARDEALDASKAKSEFLSTMSHEIRTPMNGVIGLTELLLATALDQDQLELASGVKVSAENLLVIINDILDFSKVEAGKLELEEAPLSVAAMADDVGRILAGAAHAKGVELIVDVHHDVPDALLGDVVRIQQVLLNLASNAVKFTLDGEVIVRVSVTDQNAARVALRFDVIDTGIGIAFDKQEHLFHAFAQADSSTTRRFGGTGLGLAICRQLAGLMGAKLGLVSVPGEGSTFWFEVSLRRADVGLAFATGDRRRLAGTCALVVDDNATNRKILRRQLISWGVDATEAVDGYEALELAAGAAAAGHPFDLGVIDFNMPGMDGLELAKLLKSNAATAAMPLFLLSSSGQRFGVAESHVRGFAASLTKPVRSSELFDCLITVIDGAHATPAPREAILGPERPKMMGTILLVEDNKMNQLVGSKALAKLGFRFDIANHGGEAVSAIRARHYDAVLMDCQMPEMDGYETTAEIRRIEGASRQTPIIAMTAAAMEGDRERCLAAGMDDYITKPVRLDAVAAVLDRWVVARGSDGAEIAPAAPSHGDGRAEPLDQSQIDLLRSLDDGDGAVFGEIIDQFLIQTTQGRDELVRVVGDGDTHAIERTTHLLGGASANVGANGLAAVCAEIETQARAAKLEDAARLMARFDTEFARVRDALSLLLSRT